MRKIISINPLIAANNVRFLLPPILQNNVVETKTTSSPSEGCDSPSKPRVRFRLAAFESPPDVFVRAKGDIDKLRVKLGRAYLEYAEAINRVKNLKKINDIYNSTLDHYEQGSYIYQARIERCVIELVPKN